ncbi:MAG: Glu-tRNA(Gln) amidotransferase subunit GatE [archaeon]|nr:Glu-tRNA(Gln) amidotransferase subunit GatE [archaeon]
MAKERQQKSKDVKTADGKTIIKAGLEIHQQLDTGKLFCRCPSILRQDEPNWIVKRKLHAVAGESGEVDVAAKHEISKGKEFIYQGYKDTNCLVEFDEEPPHEIDKEALKVAVQIALLLNCEINPYSQIMRKTVIDGSNTSGFQRTALIARNGFIETSFGRVSIDTLFLEEDSARPPTRETEEPGFENSKIWKLDRLGVPLVEIATGPHMHFPEQVKEAALKIGEILRACKVKRGIGTIRQDVNISTKNHPRVEIKGFQDPAMMIKTVELEAERQNKEGKKGKSEVRKANPDGTSSFMRPMPGAARMYPETDLLLLHISRDFINEVKASLPKLKTEMKEELKTRGLNPEMINLLLNSGMLSEFEVLLNRYNNPNFVVKLLLILRKEVASHVRNAVKIAPKVSGISEHPKNLRNKQEGFFDEKISEDIITIDILEEILDAVREKKINESDVKHVMEKVAKGESVEKALKVEKVDNLELETEIAKIVGEKPGLNANAYMGLVMAKFKGKVDGKTVMEVINKLLK